MLIIIVVVLLILLANKNSGEGCGCGGCLLALFVLAILLAIIGKLGSIH